MHSHHHSDIYKPTWCVMRSHIQIAAGQDNPVDMLPLKISEVLDTKRLRYLKNNEPETYKTLSRCIVSEPQKPNITIETIL